MTDNNDAVFTEKEQPNDIDFNDMRLLDISGGDAFMFFTPKTPFNATYKNKKD